MIQTMRKCAPSHNELSNKDTTLLDRQCLSWRKHTRARKKHKRSLYALRVRFHSGLESGKSWLEATRRRAAEREWSPQTRTRSVEGLEKSVRGGMAERRSSMRGWSRSKAS